MKTWMKGLLGAVLCLGLAACTKTDRLKPAVDAIKAGNLAQAEQLLDDQAKNSPDSKPLHALRFVLYRHLSVHGDPQLQQQYLQKAIAEYDILVQELGYKADYADMEGSLKASAEGATLLRNARQPLYGD